MTNDEFRKVLEAMAGKLAKVSERLRRLPQDEDEDIWKDEKDAILEDLDDIQEFIVNANVEVGKDKLKAKRKNLN